MRTDEDEERELIATVRNLLAQSGKPEGGYGDAVTTPAGLEPIPPEDLPDAGEVQIGAAEEVQIEAPETDEPGFGGMDEIKPESSSEPAPQKRAGIRSLIDSVIRSGNAGSRRASEDEDPVRALLDRIEKSEADAGEERSMAAPAASPPAHHDTFGLLNRMKGWREAETHPPKTSEGSVVAAVDEPEPSEDLSSGVVSVEDLGNLADLILPKSATFTVEELNINRNEHHFDFVDNARVVSEFDDLFSKAFSSASLAAAAASAAVPAEEVPEPRFGFLKKFQLPKVGEVIEEYNPAIHGPLVDLSRRPSPGLEEIELYPVNEPYAYVRVTYDGTTHEYVYHVLEPVLTPGEQELFGEIKERLFETLNITTRDLNRDEARKALRDSANTIIADYGIRIEPVGREKILYHVEKEFLGDGLIDPVMHDKYIEDISCDGVGSAIFVYHTTYESMKTSLVYQNHVELDSFVTKLAQRAGKYISIAEPMLDATMSDGSRIQMTLGSEVTAHGSTFTIRKFREEPITPTDLIEWHTFSPLGIAFLWLAVENAKSCIFAGGTASGKTTTLNAISLFIPPLAKIVTLEDTRELKLPHPNWIPSITRDSFSQDGRGEIDMYELLRAALRQRPEYILVGEVRGREALTLFQAMSTGHVTYATMHADSVASAVHRLENPPINVPRNMLSALSLMSIQVQARVGGQRIRRNKQLIEILDIDPRTNELITNEVFRWHPATDEIRYSGKSYILEQIMEDRGWSEERMQEELKRRQEVLEWMRIKKIRYFRDVSKILVSYFRDPETVVQRVRADLYGEGGSA
ncbi:type II/IV secretion system ATPase subunit [Methanoculleus sp. 7T]|uniref:type II/IV secretion system ATPase subunit n=1 Tax=Methanoculleus sp. 7T TaxID=2937282 RepID=UPI0020BD958D|nr:type II/IV secretion system ATPase subunit [Methanoculleus sp. 7T]MCK8518995.1 type II/IV secretion system ATPase subunit [Methanoculleus sp. 7T]